MSAVFTSIFLGLRTWLNHQAMDGKHVSPTCWVPNGREYCAPNFIIGGSMKCGTTSLWSYLLDHPKVLPLHHTDIDPKKKRTVLAEKEVRFFNDPTYSDLVKEYGYTTALGYYLDLFQPVSPVPGGINHGYITGEATPMYISNAGTAERIVASLPEVKLILMFRHPIDRAYSDYWFRKSLKTKTPGQFDISGLTHDEVFEQCMRIEMEIIEFCNLSQFKDDPSIESFKEFNTCCKDTEKKMMSKLESDPECQRGSPLSSLCYPDNIKQNCQVKGLFYGIYFPQVFEYLSVFKRENIKFIRSETFYSNPEKVMEEVSEFLHLDYHDWKNIIGSTFNIVNPNTIAGAKQDIITFGSKGLQVGSSNSTSEYPPLNPKIKESLHKMLEPYNKALAKLVGNDEFLWNDL